MVVHPRGVHKTLSTLWVPLSFKCLHQWFCFYRRGACACYFRALNTPWRPININIARTASHLPPQFALICNCQLLLNRFKLCQCPQRSSSELGLKSWAYLSETTNRPTFSFTSISMACLFKIYYHRHLISYIALVITGFRPLALASIRIIGLYTCSETRQVELMAFMAR